MKNDGSTFQERLARAAAAKQKALEKFRSRPLADAAVLADRNAVRIAREAAQAERRATRAAELKVAKDAKLGKAEEASAQLAAPSEADLKAARDARYAARKKRR